MIELLTPAQMAEVDRRTVAAGTPLARLMEDAGYAVANTVAAHHPFGVRIALVAGPGDNGGDAYVAGRVLAERGYDVILVPFGAPAEGSAAAGAAANYRGPRAAGAADLPGRIDVVVDGLFGGGLSRDITDEAAALVAAVNAAGEAGASVYAIDLPSGIDGATGAVRGIAVTAHRTVTFARRRIGHVLLPGRVHCGAVTVADIGISEKTVGAVLKESGRPPVSANEPPLWRAARPRRRADGHKYRSGHALVVSGPAHATGASRLAARAALRAGAGLATLASHPSALLVNACHLTAVMLARADGPDGLASLLADERLNAVCLGPGLPPDEETRALVAAACASRASVVLDAGALTAFEGDADGLAGLAASTDATRAVLTPHEGEFARLFGASDADKLARAREAASRSGAVVVLKGPDTVIAAPDGRAAINPDAPASLATAGTGDVLAGIITAFLAQGAQPFEAAAMGVWLHAEAAREAGPALIAEDLVEAVRPARATFEAL